MEALKEVGVDEVIVYCVNDGAVMMAWEKAQGCASEDFIKFGGDPTSELTLALDQELKELGEGQAEVDGTFGPYYMGLFKRCKRFALYIMDGEIKITKVAEALTDPAGDDFPEVTLAPALLEAIKTEGLVGEPSTLHKPRDVTAQAAEIEAAVAKDKVVLFSKPDCPFCKATKELLTEKGVEFTAIEVTTRDDAENFQVAMGQKSGQRTFPNVYINGEFVGGADATKEANESGKLDELLKLTPA